MGTACENFCDGAHNSYRSASGLSLGLAAPRWAFCRAAAGRDQVAHALAALAADLLVEFAAPLRLDGQPAFAAADEPPLAARLAHGHSPELRLAPRRAPRGRPTAGRIAPDRHPRSRCARRRALVRAACRRPPASGALLFRRHTRFPSSALEVLSSVAARTKTKAVRCRALQARGHSSTSRIDRQYACFPGCRPIHSPPADLEPP